MSDVHSDPGYLSLYCFLGLHIYAASICVHCDRREPLISITPTVNN